jgi:ketosteroid isomerase-like protein
MTKESGTGKVELIKDLIVQSERVWLARDLDAYMALHDDQVVLLWPDQAPIIGREATHWWYHGILERLEYLEMRHDIEEIEVAGSWAFAWGFSSGVSRVKVSGERNEYSLKFVYILRKQTDGSWAFYRVIFNFYSSCKVS